MAFFGAPLSYSYGFPATTFGFPTATTLPASPLFPPTVVPAAPVVSAPVPAAETAESVAAAPVPEGAPAPVAALAVPAPPLGVPGPFGYFGLPTFAPHAARCPLGYTAAPGAAAVCPLGYGAAAARCPLGYGPFGPVLATPPPAGIPAEAQAEAQAAAAATAAAQNPEGKEAVVPPTAAAPLASPFGFAPTAFAPTFLPTTSYTPQLPFYGSSYLPTLSSTYGVAPPVTSYYSYPAGYPAFGYPATFATPFGAAPAAFAVPPAGSETVVAEAAPAPEAAAAGEAAPAGETAPASF